MRDLPFGALETVSLETLLTLLSEPDGHTFYNPDYYTGLGFPFAFVSGLYKTHRPNEKTNPLDAIFEPGTGKKLKRLKAVRELDFWWALANHVGADTREAATKIGRGTQARALRDVIVIELEKYLSEPTCLDCDRLGFMRGRSSEHFEEQFEAERFRPQLPRGAMVT